MSNNRDQINDVRGLLFHVNNVVHTRTNLLLVAESIFFAAIAALWKEEGRFLKLTISVLGILMTAMLLFASATLYTRSNVLTKKLEKIDATYLEYMGAVPRKYAKVTWLLSYALPATFLAAWVLVFVVILEGK